MQEFIETFHIDWKLMIAQLFNFGIVFLAFYLLAAKPLRKLMKERGEVISKGVNDAKTNAEILEKTRKASEEIIAQARIEATKFTKEAKKDLEKLGAEYRAGRKADNDKWRKERVAQMEVDKKALVESAKNDIIALAMLAAEKILAEKNTQNKQK